MKKNSVSVGIIVSGCLALLFAFIALYTLFFWGRIQSFPTYPASAIFALLNLSFLVLVTFGGGAMVRYGSSAGYASVCTATGLYTLAQFLHLGFAVREMSLGGYVFYHLIVLLLYLMIFSASLLVGHKHVLEDSAPR